MGLGVGVGAGVGVKVRVRPCRRRGGLRLLRCEEASSLPKSRALGPRVRVRVKG